MPFDRAARTGARCSPAYSTQDGSARLPSAARGRRALVGRALDAAPDAATVRRPARRQRLPRHHRGAAGGGAGPVPRRGEHAARRVARLRGDARRPREAARAPRSRTTASSTRSTRTSSLRQVVISHRSPEREELLREIRRRYPPEQNQAHPVSEVLRSGEPFLAEDARDEAIRHAAVDEEHLALYRDLEATSYIVVPLEARGRLLGDDLARHRGVAATLRPRRPRSRPRDRAPGGAGDRQRPPLPRRAGVVCAARHAAGLGAGRDRLLGPRPALRPRERRAGAS